MSLPNLRFPEFKDKWNLIELGKVVEFKKGSLISKADISSEGKPCILYGELYTKYGPVISEVVSRTNRELINPVIGQKNDVLIPSSGESAIDIACASAIDTDEQVILGGDLNVLTPLNGVNGKFISYQINGVRKVKLSTFAQGASVVHLYNNSLNKFEITLPDTKEQQKIADFFALIDRRVEKQQLKVEALQKQRKGLLQKIFSQELRFKADDGKEFPEWEYTTLSNKIEIGSCIRVHQKDWKTAGIPFYRARDIVALKNGLTIEPLYISKKDYDMRINKSGKVQQGDVMVTGVGTIGVPYLILDNNDIYFKDGNVIWLKNNNTLVDKYLYYYMLSDNVQNYIKVTSGIGTVGTYTIENARKTPLLVPCSKEQQKISDFLFKVDQKYEKERAKLEALKVQRRGFMSQMFI